MNWLGQAVERARAKIDATLNRLGNEFPHVSEGAQWITSGLSGWENTHADWTAGFWPGVLWSIFELTADERYRETALRYCRLLESRLGYDSHDLGFLFFPSCARGYDISGEPWLREWALLAARRMAQLYNPSAKLIALGAEGRSREHAAIDTMANLDLLWWAYHEEDCRLCFEAAKEHAASSARQLVRDDGSTFHVLRFVPETGKVRWRGSRQGRSDASCWSRGQAWALSGFVTAFQETGDALLRETLQALYRYVKAHVPDDFVPYWDFEAGGMSAGHRDSSSAAILASALLSCDGTEGMRDAPQWGVRILESLITNYSSDRGSQDPGLLRHGCFHAPLKVATDSSLIWGDYFYLDALVRAQQLSAAPKSRHEERAHA